MIFDTHTHLNAEQFNDDIPETIAHAQELGVTEMAVVGFDEPTIEKSLLLSQEYANIYSIIGWHPTEAGSYTPEVLIITGWRILKRCKKKSFAVKLRLLGK